MKKPYITLEEALAAREEGRRSIKFLTEDNGCINGCCSGVTICSETEFNPEPCQRHDRHHPDGDCLHLRPGLHHQGDDGRRRQGLIRNYILPLFSLPAYRAPDGVL